jgi:hypothetical protein
VAQLLLLAELAGFAGFAEHGDGPDGGLLSQPVLVFKGPMHEALKVFDQNVRTVGTAWSSQRGMELRDTNRSLLLAVEEEGGGWRRPTFLVRGPDGSETCSFGRPHLKGRGFAWPVTSPTGEPLGFFKEEAPKSRWSNFSKAAAFEDATGTQVVRLIRESDLDLGEGEYVADIASSAGEPLRTIGIAAIIVWDLWASISGVRAATVTVT